MLSIIVVITIVMILVYSLMDRIRIFKMDEKYIKINSNAKIEYRYQKWEEYGYLKYLSFIDFVSMQLEEGKIDEATSNEAKKQIGDTREDDNPSQVLLSQMFEEYAKENGYTIERIDAKKIGVNYEGGSNGTARYFAYKNLSVFNRVFKYFTSFIKVDNIYNSKGLEDSERGLTFTFYDPSKQKKELVFESVSTIEDGIYSFKSDRKDAVGNVSKDVVYSTNYDASSGMINHNQYVTTTTDYEIKKIEGTNKYSIKSNEKYLKPRVIPRTDKLILAIYFEDEVYGWDWNEELKTFTSNVSYTQDEVEKTIELCIGTTGTIDQEKQELTSYSKGFTLLDISKFTGDNAMNNGKLYFPVQLGKKKMVEIEKVFSPAILGNGTTYKYLLYFDEKFPFVHQNLIKIKLGLSYSVKLGVDVWDTMTQPQGFIVKNTVYFPAGSVEESSVDLHSARYVYNSLSTNRNRFVDDYTSCDSYLDGKSQMGYSFTIGIISAFITYIIAIPLGLIMARHKDGLLDTIGTLYIVFIISVPSLAYIFMFSAIGGKLFNLPTTFDRELYGNLVYILPIISLALPSVASLMKWTRRYMIDQMNSDYVKFARSGGLSENEIFSKHILKNAMIPITHGIPGNILGQLTGAIITESVYTVPGVGNVLTRAINYYDNGVIIGVTLFYASLSVISVILGDILMATVDPRISLVEKGR